MATRVTINVTLDILPDLEDAEGIALAVVHEAMRHHGDYTLHGVPPHERHWDPASVKVSTLGGRTL